MTGNLVPGEYAKVIKVPSTGYNMLVGRVGVVTNVKQDGASPVYVMIEHSIYCLEQDELERVVNYCYSCGRHD